MLAALPLAGAEWEAMQRSARTASVPTPLAWVAANAVIATPGLGVAPFVPHQFQADVLMDRSPRRIVLKARQTGLSTTIALEALYYALHQSHDRTLFISRNQELAGLLVQYVQVALSGLANPPRMVAESQSKLVFPNGSEIVSLPANPSTGRGYPASRVYLDEAAYLAYDDLILQGVLPTLSHGGPLTILSTPHGRNNAFFRLWSGLEGGAWSHHTVRWDVCPRYTSAWAEQTRAGMTRQAWAEEYECDFAASGDAVFDPDDLALARTGWSSDPEGCEEYVTAWDIGRRQDHSVGLTLGRRGEVWHEVAYARVLEPYPVVQTRIDDRNRAFPGHCRVESNGVGDPVIENLETTVEPFTTTVRSKVQAIQALQLLIQQGNLRYGSEQLDRELSLYQWDDKGLVQDSVIAAAIAAYAAQDPLRAYAGVFGQQGTSRAAARPTTPDPKLPVQSREELADLAAYFGERRRW
jgi:hypothetical protein